MLLSTRVTPTFLLLVFRGRIPSRQTKIMILILLISLINPPTVFSPVSDLVSITYFLEPKSLLLESALEDRMIGKVYSRKKVVVPKLIQVHESELASRNKVTISHPSLQTEFELQSKKSMDQNLSIAIRKGMRECIKRPLYLLSHIVSFEKLSPSHKGVLISLNNIHILTTLFKAFFN